MNAFREHFLDRYFGFRERYVAAVGERAPSRLRMAIVAEIARLAFMVAACGLVLAVFGVLAEDAIRREGPTLWPSVFAVCAAAAAGSGVLALRGLIKAGSRLRGLREGAP